VVSIDHALSSPLAWGIVIGLVLGKPIGVVLASRAAVATGVGVLPEGLRWRDVTGMGVTAGIGFTVALFIAGLAYTGRPLLLDAAVIAILAASVVSGVFGQVVFRLGSRRARG
jgi:NhaA family Na+:H+ antiporter